MIKLAEKGKSLLEKMKHKENQNSSNSKKLMDIMFDLKDEISSYTGIQINMEQHINETFKEMKKNGVKCDPKQIKTVKKLFENKDKRHGHKALFMAECMAYDMEYSVEHEALIFTAKHGHEKKENEKEIIVPLKLVVGVTGTFD